ncbi:MAG: hypothetical protein ACR2KA_06230 [Opitutales bacterium]
MSVPFEKKSIPEQFAEKLLSDILQSKFGSLLPSVHELVVRYDLNPVSVHKGVTLLVKRGVLLNRGPRRRLAIAEKPASKEPCGCKLLGVPCCRPLILVGADPSEVSSTLMMAMHDVQQASRANGGGCVTVALGGLSGKAKAAAVKAALLEHKPSHVLLLYCDEDVYEQVSLRPVKLAVLGGGAQSRKAVKLAADMGLLASAAFEDLIQLGHRKFRLMMLGRPQVSAEKRRLKEYALSRRVEAYVVSAEELSLASMRAAISQALQEGVTAFAFPRPEDLVLASACLEMIEVKVPSDVSLVLLLSGPYDLMQKRQPAHFKISKEAIISLVLGWFEFGENRSERITREAIATYVRGKTVGPVS